MSENLPAAVPALRGRIHPNGLELPEDTTFEEWSHELKVVWWMYEWSPWALADALAFGENKWPERYQQAVKVTGRAIQTLYNKTYLARQFPRENGLRSDVLTPAHHGVLMGMPDQKKRKYLKEGEKLEKESGGHLSVAAFKGYVLDQERNPDGATTETIEPPARCEACFGSGKCSACHGSGEEPMT